MEDQTMQAIGICRDAVLNSHRFLFYSGQLYELIDHIYVPISPTLIGHYLDVQASRLYGDEFAKIISAHVRAELVGYVVASCMLRDDEVQARERTARLAFSNAYVDLDDQELAAHEYDSNGMFFSQLPHKLDPAKLVRASQLDDAEAALRELAPNIWSFFCDLVDDPLLQLHKIAYCLLRANPYKLAFMELGEKDSGKTTYLRLVQRVLGEANYASVSLQALTDYPFALAELYGKLANIFDDLPTALLRQTGQFKMLTGESTISAARKFKEPIKFQNYAKPIFSANRLPHLREIDDEAFFSRWVITQYTRRFPRSDYAERLLNNEAEIEGLIVAALIDLRVLRKKNLFEASQAQDYLEMWRRDTNSVYAFVRSSVEESRLVLGPGERIVKEELYQAYTAWSEEHDVEPETKLRCTQELERLFHVGSARVLTDGHSVNAYKGIGMPPKGDAQITQIQAKDAKPARDERQAPLQQAQEIQAPQNGALCPLCLRQVSKLYDWGDRVSCQDCENTRQAASREAME